MRKIYPGNRDDTVTTQSLLKPDVLINVWVDGSGGYFCYADNKDYAMALIDITEDPHELLVMRKEYNTLMRQRRQ